MREAGGASTRHGRGSTGRSAARGYRATSTALAVLATLACTPVAAQTTPQATLDPVVISAHRGGDSAFDTPAAVSTVTRETIRDAGPQVNLSEALVGVPGISVLNRQNYSQDLQLSIRGFGARSTFGIRGVRLIVDGIPATMPDGQGQASSIDLSSAGRIEVLRGPLAQLYGNAAGGVIRVYTEDDALVPTATLSAFAGPYGELKFGTKFSTSTPGWGLTLDATQFRTDGYRDHSQAERRQLNGRWQTDLTPQTHMSVVLNVLDQPYAQDPLGLTRAQWQADPRQSVPIATQQGAGKTVRQQQIGTVVEHRLGDDTSLSARLYVGTRDLDNALSIPLAAQQAVTSSGGIVRFGRDYYGTAAQLRHRIKLGDERVLRLTAGVEYNRMDEDRQGYINNGGTAGALKRDEANVIEDSGLFAQAALDLSREWTVLAGARRSVVGFRSQDRYITPTNPDDSGAVSYAATNPVAGIEWHATPALNIYANIGRGFETPTSTELAYRPGATGLNFGLLAARSRHAEFGTKLKWGNGQRFDAALFDITTANEIVVDSNQGGRTTYKNSGHTTRRGIELSNIGALSKSLQLTLSLSALQARFDDDFVSGSGTNAVAVHAGNRLPGVPQRNAYAALDWRPIGAWGGFNGGVALVHTGRIYVDDANDDAAPAATVLNLRAGWEQRHGAWRFTQMIRVDNAFDRRYAGSVIVNDSNQRYFEPALPRNWLLALTARYEFR